jgi:hypothetical protein
VFGTSGRGEDIRKGCKKDIRKCECGENTMHSCIKMEK